MWSPESSFSRLCRGAAALAIAVLTAGCFQPLYGERTVGGGPILRDQLAAVDVLQIPAPKGTDDDRLAVEIRNALLFDLTGGHGEAPPVHRLKISISSTRTATIVDKNTGRSNEEVSGITVTYTLTETTSSERPVFLSTMVAVRVDEIE